MDRYCHACAILRQVLIPNKAFTLTGTEYQLEKYIKHTAPTSTYNFNSVFTRPASATYSGFIVSAMAAGNVLVDDQGRKTITWIASAQTGFMLKNGLFVGPTDAVKVVYVYDKDKMHGFPIETPALRVAYCKCCGLPIPL